MRLNIETRRSWFGRKKHVIHSSVSDTVDVVLNHIKQRLIEHAIYQPEEEQKSNSYRYPEFGISLETIGIPGTMVLQDVWMEVAPGEMLAVGLRVTPIADFLTELNYLEPNHKTTVYECLANAAEKSDCEPLREKWRTSCQSPIASTVFWGFKCSLEEAKAFFDEEQDEETIPVFDDPAIRSQLTNQGVFRKAEECITHDIYDPLETAIRRLRLDVAKMVYGIPGLDNIEYLERQEHRIYVRTTLRFRYNDNTFRFGMSIEYTERKVGVTLEACGNELNKLVDAILPVNTLSDFAKHRLLEGVAIAISPSDRFSHNPYTATSDRQHFWKMYFIKTKD